MRGYREFLRAVARFLGVPEVDGETAAEATIAEVRDRRAAADGYAAELLDDAGVVAVLVDTGYGGPDALDPAALEVVLGRPVRTIVRVETVAERILADDRGHADLSPARFGDALAAELETALDDGAVGLKSIAAYRSGLDLAPPSAAGLRRALADRAVQARRVDAPALIAVGFGAALEIGRARGVPVQVHVGFGDEDLRLPAADPSLLEPWLRDPAAEGCPVVLLHGHPFVDRAAFLASLYPDVFVDLSLAIPLLGARAAGAAIAEALALCPATKLLAASDGHSYPEMHWRGARLWREALATVLADEVRADRIGPGEALDIATAILADNARRLYRL